MFKKDKAARGSTDRVKKTSGAEVRATPVLAFDPDSPMGCLRFGSRAFLLSHALLVNNAEYSDVSFVFAGMKKETVAAHSFVLLGRKCGALLQQV